MTYPFSVFGQSSRQKAYDSRADLERAGYLAEITQADAVAFGDSWAGLENSISSTSHRFDLFGLS